MLNYEISGKGTEHLVLLHGLMEDLTIWADMEPHLNEKFRLVKIDLPGHGKSTATEEVLTMEMMAQKVKLLLDELNIGECHLLGHSMGGYTALAFAERYPELLQSMTLFFSTYFPDDEEKKKTRQKSFRIIEEEYTKYVNAGVPLLFNSCEAETLEPKIQIAKDVALRTANTSALAAVKGIMERPDRSSVMENFEGRILVLAGKHDNAVDAIKMLRNLPKKSNIKSYLLDCGHNGHWEKPEICAAVINRELLHH